MTNYELLLTSSAEENLSETIQCLTEAVAEISAATEKDFETIKNKKWYKRLWELITFSKNNQKIQARGVANLAKLSEIIMKAVVLVSKQSADTALLLKESIDQINCNLEKIELLTDYQIKLAKAVKEIKRGYKERLSVSDLNSEKQNAMSAVFFKYIKSLDESIVKNIWSQHIFGLIYSPSAPADINYQILDSFNDDETILLYRLIQSYYYVSTNEFDEDSELIDHFRISRKDEKIIKSDIEDTIKFLGIDYYISSLTDGFEDSLVDEELIEWSDDDEESIKEESDESKEPYFIIFEDLKISSITNVESGETLEYKNKNIIIESIINCKGKIIFDCCNITYNSSSRNSEIILSDSASLVANNCTFYCKGNTDKLFIKSTDYKSCISFDHCKFNDCSHFVGDYIKEFTLVNSQILNCANEFVKLFFYHDEDICNISDNVILNEKLSAFNKPDESFLPITLFDIHQPCDVNMDLSICNNSVTQKKEFRELLDNNQKIIYFDIHNGTISNCTFYGTDKCVENAIKVENCIFRNCNSPISSGENEKYRANIKKCFFRNCTNALDVRSDTTVSNCKFYSCKGKLINGWSAFEGGVVIEFCEFLNHQNIGKNYRDSSILLRRSKKSKSNSNDIKNCVFDGCVLSENYLITSACSEKPHNIVCYVQNCEFRNCKSRRNDNKIIREYDFYYGFLDSKNEFKAINTYDCTGLNKVNKEGSICDPSTKEAVLAFAESIDAPKPWD